ncbi:hypothetical protein ABDI30_09810 [Paenibacillus cisolokensis]|uniref:hypothetical protein n=1 Tax=Paenibacillus cisolokensis TaxID=1658519 RepID=UPI003D290001
MMRLLKYDWKRNSTTVLGTLAVLIIIQTAIMVTGMIRGWDPIVMLVSSLMGYSSIGVLLIVLVVRTFDYNIRSYQRRLLPLRSVWTILSPLFMGVLGMIALAILVLTHLWLHFYFLGFQQLGVELGLLFQDANFLLGIWRLIWGFSYIILSIFFATAVARTIPRKSGVWVGILVFVLLHNMIDWVGRGLLGQGYWTESEITETGLSITMGPLGQSMGKTIYEMVVAALLLFATAYLIDRKVEA